MTENHAVKKPSGFISLRSIAKAVLPTSIAVEIRARLYWRAHQDEFRLIKLLASRDRNSIEIGAADGLYTCLLARLCRHLDAYEPNPDFLVILSRIRRSNLTLSPLAISDRESTAELRVPKGRGGVGRPLEASLDMRFGDECRTIRIDSKSLDAMNHADVGFIKIDVEGHEAAVIRGAERTLRRDRPRLWTEIEQRHIKHDIHEVFAGIESLGYVGLFLYQKVLLPICQFNLTEHQLALLDNVDSPLYVNNFAFVPKEEGVSAIIDAWN